MLDEEWVMGRSRRRIDDFDVVAFDADDTLWQSEDGFQQTEARFAELVSPFAPIGIDVLDALHATEKTDIASQGYGVKAFTLSMVRAAISMTDGAVPTEVIRQLVDLGAALLVEPVHLLPDVPEVLARVGRDARLVMITKGDLVHQTRKVTTSGLEHHFTDIEIVLEKDPATYAKLLARFGVEPDRFCMVGNSVRSDILPVMAIGAHAVHVPYHLTWELERVDDHTEDVVALERLADLPAWLGLD
ncbi:MAG: HAD family hydrolase [Ilumatobacter sp.]|uniref:HAD family hydrolase n=1 Tax=Ilumatobacter sp. TaxID=1967498 RepID=UPI0032990289